MKPAQNRPVLIVYMYKQKTMCYTSTVGNLKYFLQLKMPFKVTIT